MGKLRNSGRICNSRPRIFRGVNWDDGISDHEMDHFDFIGNQNEQSEGNLVELEGEFEMDERIRNKQ